MITEPFLPPLNEVNMKLEDIWNSKWLTNMGQQHKEFEENLKKFLKVENLTLFCNGTIALQIAMNALEIKGEVITTAFTFPATINSIINSGCNPVFADISISDYNLDPDQIEKCITPNTSAIMPVHVFGNPCDVEKIQKIAEKYNLKIIYDAAHCFGVEYKDVPLCLYGDTSMLSFHATKIFNTIEGGALIYKEKKYSDLFYYWKNFGIKNQEEVILPGINGKMNEIQAAIGNINLKYVSYEIEKRKNIFQVYSENLRDIPGIRLLKYRENTKPNYQYIPILIDEKLFGSNRDEIYNEFMKYNVFTRKYFHPLGSTYLHLQTKNTSSLPISEKVCNEILCLPTYGELKSDQVIKICDILKQMTNK